MLWRVSQIPCWVTLDNCSFSLSLRVITSDTRRLDRVISKTSLLCSAQHSFSHHPVKERRFVHTPWKQVMKQRWRGITHLLGDRDSSQAKMSGPWSLLPLRNIWGVGASKTLMPYPRIIGTGTLGVGFRVRTWKNLTRWLSQQWSWISLACIKIQAWPSLLSFC